MSGTSDFGVGEIFACGIQNLGKVCMWNPASWALESVVHLELSGLLQTIEIRNPNSTDKESGSHSDHSGDSRILDLVGLPHMERS